MAILQHESSVIQKEIDKITDIVEAVKEISFNETPDMIGFLLKFKQLVENIEVCLAKPIRNNELITVPTDNFPREIEERKKDLDDYRNLKELIAVKDDIIWNLILKCKGKRTEDNLFSTGGGGNLNLICQFCGIGLDELTVNSYCMKNDPNQQKGSFSNSMNISQEHINNKRHYFAKQPKHSKFDLNNPIRGAKLDNSANISEDFISKIFVKLISNAEKNNLDLENFIQVNFKIVNTIKGIRPILVNKLELAESEANALLSFFSFDGSKSMSNENSSLNLNGMLNFMRKAAVNQVKDDGFGNTTTTKENVNNPFENNILNEQRQQTNPNVNANLNMNTNTRYNNNGI